MESDINTAKSDKQAIKQAGHKNRRGGPRRSILFSRLTRVIFLSHLFGLVILTIGSLTLNQYSKGLIEARVENLKSQALLVTSVMGDLATGSQADAQLDVDRAREIFQRLDLPPEWRIRLHDTGQNILVDSDDIASNISVGELPPIGEEIPESPDIEEEGFSLRQFLKDGENVCAMLIAGIFQRNSEPLWKGILSAAKNMMSLIGTS